MSDALDAMTFGLGALAKLQAAAEDTRQRDLTVSLRQVECRGRHDRWWGYPCPACKAMI